MAGLAAAALCVGGFVCGGDILQCIFGDILGVAIVTKFIAI